MRLIEPKMHNLEQPMHLLPDINNVSLGIRAVQYNGELEIARKWSIG